MPKHYIGTPDSVVTKCPACGFDVIVDEFGLIANHSRRVPGTQLVFGEKPSVEKCPGSNQTGIDAAIQEGLL